VGVVGVGGWGLGGKRRGQRDKKERQESVERTLSEPEIREDNCVYFINRFQPPPPFILELPQRRDYYLPNEELTVACMP
jgi:hypothetical protein